MGVSTSKLNDQEYRKKCLQDVDFARASYKEVAECLMKNCVQQMFHAMVNEVDILTLFTIPYLKILQKMDQLATKLSILLCNTKTAKHMKHLNSD